MIWLGGARAARWRARPSSASTPGPSPSGVVGRRLSAVAAPPEHSPVPSMAWLLGASRHRSDRRGGRDVLRSRSAGAPVPGQVPGRRQGADHRPALGVTKPILIAQFADLTHPRLYWFTNLLWWGLGPALEILGLAGVRLAPRAPGQARGGGRPSFPIIYFAVGRPHDRADDPLCDAARAGAGDGGRRAERRLAAHAVAAAARCGSPSVRRVVTTCALRARLHERLPAAGQPPARRRSGCSRMRPR